MKLICEYLRIRKCLFSKFSSALLLLFLMGTLFIPSFVAADHCWNEAPSHYDLPHDSRGDCPPGSLDPADLPQDSHYSGDYDTGGGGDGKITNISGLIFRVNAILNTIVPFLIGLAVFLVMWGIFGYISHSAEEEKRAEARQFILWGVIFIFLMLSIWGLVNVLNNTFNLKKTPVDVPSVFPQYAQSL